MDEPLKDLGNVCANCGAGDNEPGSRYCQTCGSKLGSVLTPPVPPPAPSELGRIIAGRFVIQSLLWTGPTYNAYAAGLQDSPDLVYSIIEKRFTPDDPLAAVSPVSESSSTGRTSGSLEEAGAAFERFGMFKPIEHAVEGESLYIVFEEFQGQAFVHLDQLDEKQTRAIGLQLCTLAEQLHRHGWVYNGFEPYNIVLVEDSRVRLIGFDRARQTGTPVEDGPVYPSRG